jgi:hypothetical protein
LETINLNYSKELKEWGKGEEAYWLGILEEVAWQVEEI